MLNVVSVLPNQQNVDLAALADNGFGLSESRKALTLVVCFLRET